MYRNDLDFIKGLSIISVVLYHLGIVKSGYLGVDVFFAISGFLIVPKVISDICNGNFNYLAFLKHRIVRLLPLCLIISVFSLIAGYFSMIPDDYENLSQSVIATNFFSNNILSSITTKDYWAVSNEFRPLMHTWYIGILFEFYLVFPLIALLVKKVSSIIYFNYYKNVYIVFVALSVSSFLLYLLPDVSTGEKFYLFQYRFFELSIGGLLGCYIRFNREGRLYDNTKLCVISLFFLVIVLFGGVVEITPPSEGVNFDLVSGNNIYNYYLIPQNILLLITLFLILFLLISNNNNSKLFFFFIKLKFFCLLGMMSYSIFIWHQPILAFYRYIYSTDLSFLFILVFLLVVLLISYISFKFFEQKIHIKQSYSKILLVFSFVLINATAFSLYMNAGVVRDVPELNIDSKNVHRNMFSDYTDRIRAFDKEFPLNNGKINVLAIGNSYARDLSNVLLESDVADNINLSYIYVWHVSELEKKYIERIKQSDYIFVFGWKHEIPYFLWENLKPNAEVWGIGTKSFGSCIGTLYKNRYKKNYYTQTIRINPNFFVINNMLKEEWGEKYIDLLGVSLNKDSSIIAFTNNHKYMSQDSRHYTRDGAKQIAKMIDFNTILIKK